MVVTLRYVTLRYVPSDVTGYVRDIPPVSCPKTALSFSPSVRWLKRGCARGCAGHGRPDGVLLRRTRSDGGATVFFSFFFKILFGDASQMSRLGEPWREVGFESGHAYESRVLAGLTWLRYCSFCAWSMAKEKFGLW